MLISSNGKCRTLLRDKIRENVTRLQSERNISTSAVEKVLDSFNPLKGLCMDEIPYYKFHDDRITEALN